MNTVLSLLIPLGITIVIEYIVMQLLYRKRLVLIPVVVTNVITNPALNLFYKFLLYETLLEGVEIDLIIIFLEFIVFIVEGIIYHFELKIKWSEAIMYSFAANLFSYFASFCM